MDEKLAKLYIGGQPPGAIRPRRAAPEIKIMATLAANDDCTAQELIELTCLGPAQLYPALIYLGDDGIVTRFWEDAPSSPRRRYRLTEKGTKAWQAIHGED